MNSRTPELDKYFEEKYPLSQRKPHSQLVAERKNQIAINTANRRFKEEDEGTAIDLQLGVR